jgi:hypothetical protein
VIMIEQQIAEGTPPVGSGLMRIEEGAYSA